MIYYPLLYFCITNSHRISLQRLGAILTYFSLRFHDHQMITSRKDALGTELLSVPFQKDELEAILEDLMS